MSAVEKLQAAIDKLEALKAETTPGPWEGRAEDTWFLDGVLHRVIRSGPHEVAFTHDRDAEVIVTLHRTVVAQLAILRFAVDGLYDLPEFLMLADAILGVDS